MHEVYEQVILICTTINVVIIFGCLVLWITGKVRDRHEKKKNDKDS